MNKNTEFYLKNLNPLVGGKITGTVWAPDECGDDMEFFGLTVEKKDGQVVDLLLLADDEGNGPGSFLIQKALKLRVRRKVKSGA